MSKQIPFDMYKGEPAKLTRSYEDFRSISKTTRMPLTSSELLAQILHNLDIEVLLKTIGQGFASRTITVTTTPVEIIPPAKNPRGYIILNPTPSSGLTTPITLLPSALRTTVGSPYTSVSNGVASYLEAHIFLSITANNGAPTVAIDMYALDPLSGNYALTQADIFTSPSAVGTYYANIGSLGVATDFQCLATLTGGVSSTFSVSGVLKNGVPGSLTGLSNTVYIAGRDVTVTNGYPILEGNKETFFLRENVALYAVSAGSVTLKVFELQ